MKKNLWILATVCLLALTGCTSFEDIKQQADAGNADMQYKAAVMLMNGDGTEVDHNAAEKYMTAAFKAKNQSAACHVIKDIQRNSRGDQAKLLMEAYDILFEKKVYSAPEKLEIMADFPEYIIKYILYLDANGYNASAFAVKQYALKNVGKCPLRSRYIRRYAQKIKSYKTAFEKAEEKRIAEEKRRFQEKKRKAEEKRIAEEKRRFQEEKRKAEEKRIAEEKAKYPLKAAGYTPMKLYKKIHSGISRGYFNKNDVAELKNNNSVRYEWANAMLPVLVNEFSLEECPVGRYPHKFILLNSNKHIEFIEAEDAKENDFLIGINFDIKETKNISARVFVDKFKSKYPDLKQKGSLEGNNSDDIKSIQKDLVAALQKMKILKDKLLPENICKLSQKEVYSVKKEIMSVSEKILILNNRLALIKNARSELILYNADILINIQRYRNQWTQENEITVSIKDAKLIKHCEQKKKDLINAIKEYNKQGEQKKKQKEMQQLDF